MTLIPKLIHMKKSGSFLYMVPSADFTSKYTQKYPITRSVVQLSIKMKKFSALSYPNGIIYIHWNGITALHPWKMQLKSTAVCGGHFLMLQYITQHK